MSPRSGWGAGMVAVLLVAGVALLPGAARAAGEDPVAEVAAALRSLGPPGILWGRFAIEEESPAGAWTPLAGVEVTLYPATPTLVAELERIRQSARTSGAQYESAVARVLAALAVHQARVAGQNPPAPPAAEDTAPAGPAIPVPSKATPAKATPARCPGRPARRSRGRDRRRRNHPRRRQPGLAGASARIRPGSSPSTICRRGTGCSSRPA